VKDTIKVVRTVVNQNREAIENRELIRNTVASDLRQAKEGQREHPFVAIRTLEKIWRLTQPCCEEWPCYGSDSFACVVFYVYPTFVIMR